MRKLVLLNPKAAGGRAAKLEPSLRAWLREHSVQAQLVITTDIAHARQTVAALPRESRVVLVGGDGTVHQLLPALLEGAHSLGLVPYGSGNDTARALGLLKMPWREALDHALKAPAQRVDIGIATIENQDTPFISSIAMGFDAAIALRAQHAPKWLIGLPRYLYATFLELVALKKNEVAIAVDGRRIERAPVLFSSVLNTPTFGSGMPAVPHAQINDGALNLLVAGEFNKLGTLVMLPRLLLGMHLSHARVMTLPFKQLQMQSTQPLPLAADGEPLAPCSYASLVNVCVLPQALACVIKGQGAA